MTRDEACKRLDGLASNAENENYHTLAGELWELMPKVAQMLPPMLVIIVSELGTETLMVDA